MIALLLLAVAQAFLIYSFILIQYKKELQSIDTIVTWFVLQSFWCIAVGWWAALVTVA